MFPVVLDLAGRLVVVVGYGAVGKRKAAAARAAGAAVWVVDPNAASSGSLPPCGGGLGWGVICVSPPTRPAADLPHKGGGEEQHAGSIYFLQEPYHPDHLAGVSLVFACATPEVNARVVADTRARGIWVNSASDPDHGDFTLPSVLHRGDLTIAVSTGGASPALARRIREKLEAEFDSAFTDWVQLLAELRTEVLATIPDPARRAELLDSFADWPWLGRLRAEGIEAVRSAMRASIMTR